MYNYNIKVLNGDVVYTSDSIFSTYDEAYNNGLEHLDAWEAINDNQYCEVIVNEVN